MIYFISTPIGNLEDITIRAIKQLRKCKYIICEDTRRTTLLLNKYKIYNKEKIIYNDFNKYKQVEKIIELAKTNDLCFVSDAGMPIISDPGFELIKKLRENNLSYTILPGPSASLTALCLSSLKPDKFLFLGFLPKLKSDKFKLLKKYKNIKATFILYENQNRVNETLEIIRELFGNVKIAIVRELTKIYEDLIVNNISNLLEILKDKVLKGEIVILFESEIESEQKINNVEQIKEIIKKLKRKNFSNREIKNIIDIIFKINKDIYKLLNEEKEKSDL
ncbi:MAG TPA: 16S rRNA (cytidine(1402)-2'-O)-methyltransferase [bacterium]|nr:16S rRNA (cytidine(1402)-2'-O)-methyltransferase [bacterium]HOL47838.1 16S rRNA (cytidine(1402)-2'-O)-methyltransferase [bacterium]HPQ19551.1 16S rRNA (cytidine(1402)-2'-O)-methyltransferase [bacterium]